MIYQWRSKVKAKKTNAKLAKFREEQREAAEQDSRRAAALGAIFSMANVKKMEAAAAGGSVGGVGDKTADESENVKDANAIVSNKSAMQFLDLVNNIRQKDENFDKVKEKEIATKRILKSGIGVNLLEAVKNTREKEKREREESEAEEKRLREAQEERRRRKAERDQLRLKREERKAKESIIVVEEIDTTTPTMMTSSFVSGEGERERRKSSFI